MLLFCPSCSLVAVDAVFQELLQFWTSLSAAEVDSSDILHLASGTHWLGDAGMQDNLYVRDCYREPFQLIRNATAPARGYDKVRKVLVTGTPGIGKSQFALYFLWQLSKEGNPKVLFQLGDTYYFFTGGNVQRTTSAVLPAQWYYDKVRC